jgi:hypothetical protein
MKIIDNAISVENLNIIQEIMLGCAFPWFYNTHTIDEHTSSGLNDFQFTHQFYVDANRYGYPESNHFNIIKPILEILKCRILIRAKANLRVVAPEKDMVAGWHRDYEYKSKTAIFYVNSNNGYTMFRESGKKVESVENRLVVFPTELEHCGVSCTDNKQRVVINFNFLGQEL